MDKNLDSFVSDNYVRLTYIAFFTQWAFWGLIYFLRHVIGDPDKTVAAAAAAAAAATAASEDPEAVAKTDKKFWHRPASESLSNRVTNVHNIVRDNTLLLLSVLALNTFGNASTRAVMIITWIYFAFSVVFAFTELVISNHYIRLIYSAIFYGLGLAIGGLAFARGW